MKDFLSIIDCPAELLGELLELSATLKEHYKAGRRDLCLSGKVLAMLFEKPSLRTRVSFQVAMTDLGGSAIYVKPEDIGGIGKREPVKDMARVFSRYVDGIMARTFEHQTVTELARYASVPVINGRQRFTRFKPIFADKKLPTYVLEALRKGNFEPRIKFPGLAHFLGSKVIG